jgi:hypothetical protein
MGGQYFGRRQTQLCTLVCKYFVTVTDQLHVEERQGAQEEHEEVGDEEGAPAILVAQVREPVCARGGETKWSQTWIS